MLSLLIILPLIGIFCLLFVPEEKSTLIKQIAFFSSSITFLLSLFLWIFFGSWFARGRVRSGAAFCFRRLLCVQKNAVCECRVSIRCYDTLSSESAPWSGVGFVSSVAAICATGAVCASAIAYFGALSALGFRVRDFKRNSR